MSTDAGDFGYLEAGGTPHEIGVQLGRFGAAIVHTHLVNAPAWHSVMAFRGDPRVAAMRLMVEERLPACWQEIQGLAQGLDLPLEDVFLWNCRGDVWAMAPDGCTTVLVPGHEPVIAHNEDGDPALRGHCAIARILPRAGHGFAAFVYPGSLPGHTFAATDAGLVQAVNNIRGQSAGTGLPRMVLGRAVLACATLDDAIAMIKTSPRAGAFHFSLAQCGDPRIVSVEFTHARCSTSIVEHTLCHANHLVHPAMANEAQIITGSSAARQRRGDEFVRDSAFSRPDPLALLWDRSDTALPIHREQPDDPDGENTLATALIQIGANRVNWQVYDRAGAPPRFDFADTTPRETRERASHGSAW